MKQQDTKFTANWKAMGMKEGFACDNCGQIPSDQMFIPVQWAPGSTGSVGLDCCGNLFADSRLVSKDGMAIAHWPKA